MVSIQSKAFIFSAFLSLNLLVSEIHTSNNFETAKRYAALVGTVCVSASLANTGVCIAQRVWNRDKKLKNNQGSPIAGFVRRDRPSASEIKTLDVSTNVNGNIDNLKLIMMKLDVVTERELERGVRIGGFELVFRGKEDGNPLETLLNGNVALHGFSISNLASTYATYQLFKFGFSRLPAILSAVPNFLGSRK